MRSKGGVECGSSNDALELREVRDISPDHLSVAMKYHTAIFDALVDRNKKRIVKALRSDMETAAEIIRPFLHASQCDQDPG